MPRQALGPRLYLRKRAGREAVWCIRNGSKELVTGCGEGSLEDAERVLDQYRLDRWATPKRGDRLTIGDIFMIYAEDKAVQAKDPARIGYAIDALSPFFSEKYPDEIGAADCRAYAKKRGVAPGTLRREIGTLTAALNHAVAEGHITSAPALWRPAKPPSKERWLNQAEAVKLLNACRHKHRRHLGRFILIGLYTGTRSENILGLQWRRNRDGGWIDLEAGLIYRTAEGEAATKKRRTTAKLPRQLTAHARRWRRDGNRWIVQYRGARVLKVKRSFAAAVKAAGIEYASPHVLRHTAITWAMQAGAPLPEVSGYFGITLEELQRTYWHHHPDFQSGVVGVMERRK